MKQQERCRRQWAAGWVLGVAVALVAAAATRAQARMVQIDATGVRVPGMSIQTGTVGAVSSGEDKTYVNANLDQRQFKGQNLAGWSFVNVSARGANFEGANLSGASWTNVDVSQANFRQANLTGVEMVNVTLKQADFSGAIWTDGRRCAPQSLGRCR